jgi:hypothetical protein
MEAGHPRRVATAGDLVRTVAGLFSLGAGVIHAVVMGAHFREFWLFGVFFLVVATAQAAWAAVVMIRPSRAVLMGGALLNLAVVAVWAISRLTGVPIGPDAGVPEGVGAIDLVATVEEVGAVVGAVILLAAPGALARPLREGVPVAAIGGLAALVAGITAAAVVAWRQGDDASAGAPGSAGGHGLHLVVVAAAFVAFAARALLTYRRSRTPPARQGRVPGDDPAP